MANTEKIRKRKKKWGVHTILVTPAKDGHISWEYARDGSGYTHGSYVSVTADKDWIYVSTDDYEGTAMFPKALLKEVLRELKALSGPTPDPERGEK